MKRFIFLLFIIFPTIIICQQYNFKTYSIEDGLVQSQVISICQDSKGYMWFGTNGGGVSKYDGVNFINLTTKNGLIGNTVNSIVEDSQGNLWFGTDVGISKYDGKTFTNFTTKDGLNDNTIWSILEDGQGNLWFGTFGGVRKYDGKTFTNFTTKDGLNDNTIWSILEDRQGNLWFGTDYGISKYDGKTFTNVTANKSMKDYSFMCAGKDSKGNLWFGTYKNGIYKYDGNSFTNYTNKDGLCGNRIWAIIEDRKGNLWFGSDKDGISEYNGKNFKNFTVKNGLSNNSINCILEDRECNLWLGTDGGGVIKYSGETFINYTTKEGLNNNIVYAISEDKKGVLWFGIYNGGVNKFDGKIFTNFGGGNQLISHNIVFAILEDRESNLWFGTESGISKYDGKTFTNFTTKDGLNNNSIRYIFEDKKGNMWFATHGGLSKYNGKIFKTYTTKDGLNSNWVSCILEDREGYLWFTTDGGGVSKYDGKIFMNFTTKDGLKNNSVMCILEDSKGNLWFGTYGGGISRYNYPQEGETGSFESFTTDDGLCNDNVLSMVFGDSENLWIGTDKGIDKFDVPEYYKTGKKIFKHYGKEEGFIGIECNQKAIYKDSKGNIWFGTIKGAIKYNPKEDISNTVAPFTYITNLRLFFENVDWSNYADSVNKISGLPIGLRLPHNKNHITFDFIGISLSNPTKVRYQYKLKGFEKDWSSTIKENHVTYSNLPHRQYTFEVKACNDNGVWNKKPTTCSFIISPPFWETWWFRLTVLILIMIIIYGVYLWKTAQIRRRAEVLEQKVNERTAQLKEAQNMLVDTAHRAGMAEIATGILHNVGNVLNSVKVSSQILRERIEKSKINNLQKVLNLMQAHSEKLGTYIANDEKGKMLPPYLIEVGKLLKDEQVSSLNEISNLSNGINHIEEIVAVQQNYAGVSGIVESISLSKMMDDIIRMFHDSFNKNNINIEKDYKELPPILVEKGKLMQVFVNLLKNALESLVIKKAENKVITIKISEDKDKKYQIVEIIDNGIGIKKDNLSQIFSYGFTTKEGSKGFGLHTSALTMAELEGKLTADSDGEGMGAKFTMIVPKDEIRN